MNNPFEQFGFSLELTKDQSPTLHGSGESMHHSGGAAAETNYIYKNALKQALRSTRSHDPKGPFRTVIVGLGLGYIEISWAQILNDFKLSPSEALTLDSFETVEGLRTSFSRWVESGQNSEQDSIYDRIHSFLSPDENILESKKNLNKNFSSYGRLYEDALNHSEINRKWNIICFDAFSKKTSHPLWQETYLQDFITQHAARDCVFTTYACTGVLKKVLQENGFILIPRPGFSNKRESILALRGFFKDDQALFQTF